LPIASPGPQILGLTYTKGSTNTNKEGENLYPPPRLKQARLVY